MKKNSKTKKETKSKLSPGKKKPIIRSKGSIKNKVKLVISIVLMIGTFSSTVLSATEVHWWHAFKGRLGTLLAEQVDQALHHHPAHLSAVPSGRRGHLLPGHGTPGHGPSG